MTAEDGDFYKWLNELDTDSRTRLAQHFDLSQAGSGEDEALTMIDAALDFMRRQPPGKTKRKTN